MRMLSHSRYEAKGSLALGPRCSWARAVCCVLYSTCNVMCTIMYMYVGLMYMYTYMYMYMYTNSTYTCTVQYSTFTCAIRYSTVQYSTVHYIRVHVHVQYIQYMKMYMYIVHV